MKVIELTIDHLPYKELSPNSRVHWAVKARAVKAQRLEAGWLAKSQWGNKKPMAHARIGYAFTVTNKRRKDTDNLLAGCKSFVDGIVDAGVLVDDDSTHLVLGCITLHQGDAEQTIIRIEEL